MSRKVQLLDEPGWDPNLKLLVPPDSLCNFSKHNGKMMAETRQHIGVASRKKEEGMKSQKSRPTKSLQ